MVNIYIWQVYAQIDLCRNYSQFLFPLFKIPQVRLGEPIEMEYYMVCLLYTSRCV